MKLLAVDDDPIFLELLVSTLNEFGYDNITAVTSAMEALHELAVATVPFDCLLFDIQMPGKNGIELTKEVRQQARLAHTPIIMITSLQQREFIDQAYVAGANDYVIKPIQSQELSARIGMIKKLADLNYQVKHTQHAPSSAQSWRYADAIPLEPRDKVLNYLALENYLLTLGRLRMSNIFAFGISLDYAADRFSDVHIDKFMDTLNDVAAILIDQTKRYRPLLAYAGSGQFILVLPKTLGLNTDELEAAVNAELEVLYTSVSLPEASGAKIRIGPINRPRILDGFSATSLISNALGDLAEEVRPPRYRRLWKGAG